MRLVEVMINAAFGKGYARMHSRKIIKNAREWNRRYHADKATILLSYDIDDIKDLEKLPKLLRLLKKYDIRAGFAAIGILVKKHPGIFKELIKQGHEIINHTETHPNSEELGNNEHFDKIKAERRFEEIKKCHDTVKRTIKYEMSGFRIPHFGNQFTDDIYPMLNRLGYAYSSSTVAIRTMTEGFPFKVDGIWEFPLTCCPTHPFCIFDTSHAFRSTFARHAPEDYLKTFKDYLEYAIRNKLFVNLYHDPQDIDSLDYEQLLKMIHSRRAELNITTYKKLVKQLIKTTWKSKGDA